MDSKGTVFPFIFSFDNVVKEFDLNKVYYECKSRQIIVKPASSGQGQQQENKKDQ